MSNTATTGFGGAAPPPSGRPPPPPAPPAPPPHAPGGRRRDGGVGVVTALVRVEGKPYGLVANDCHHLGGAIDAPAADKL
ncbi:hypothetical protein, partial [Nocardia farcinica]|uniref:hypothetical protein n=1 Tax=Nocardia farcinica TaxID=37329 RepID=UPI00245831B6